MIKVQNGKLKFIDFPSGERQCVYNHECGSNSFEEIVFNFENQSEIIDLAMVVDAIKRTGVNSIRLYMPYIPYSRQDRVCNQGEAFSLKVFCDFINSLGFARVIVDNPHSDVSSALLNNVSILEDCIYFLKDYSKITSFAIVSPDAGALKKSYKTAKKYNLPVIECSKIRDTQTGAILTTKVNASTEELDSYDYLIIVDDICEYGGTFVGIAKTLREKEYKGKIVLHVTHGSFGKGTQEDKKIVKLKLLEHFDAISVLNDFSENFTSTFINKSSN